MTCVYPAHLTKPTHQPANTDRLFRRQPLCEVLYPKQRGIPRATKEVSCISILGLSQPITQSPAQDAETPDALTPLPQCSPSSAEAAHRGKATADVARVLDDTPHFHVFFCYFSLICLCARTCDDEADVFFSLGSHGSCMPVYKQGAFRFCGWRLSSSQKEKSAHFAELGQNEIRQYGRVRIVILLRLL